MTDSRKIYNSIRALKRPELIPKAGFTTKRNFWKWYSKNCAFPLSKAINFSAMDDLAAIEAGTSFPTNPTKLRTQPPYEEDGVYKIHTDCECEWHTSYLGKKYNRKELIAPISKIVPKSAPSGSKLLEENYCQSGEKQCKLLTQCDWHKSPYASEYYGQTVTEVKPITKPKPKTNVDEQPIQALTKDHLVDSVQEQPEKKIDKKPSIQNIKADFEAFLDELQLRNKENTSNLIQQNSQTRKVSDGINWRIPNHNSDLETTQEQKEFFDFLGLKRKESLTTSLSQLKDEECQRQSDDEQVLPIIEPKIKERKKNKKKKKKKNKTKRNSP